MTRLRTLAAGLLTSANPFTDICGGTYFFLDADDVAYPTTRQKTVLKIKVRPDGKLLKQHEWSLAAHIPADDCLIATMPDWDGRIWFFTQQGHVGTLDRERARTLLVEPGRVGRPSVRTTARAGV